MEVKNYGILTSLDWNSNQWKELPSAEDLEHITFDSVKQAGKTFTSLNFANETQALVKNEYTYGVIPHLYTKPVNNEQAKHVKVVFFTSYNWEDKQTYLVGLYAFQEFYRATFPSTLKDFEDDFQVNVKALPKDIKLLDNYIQMSAHPETQKFLPKGKTPGKMVFNYLTRENVFKILDVITKENPDDKKFSNIKYRLLKSIDNL